jgi:hypothetical protein
MVQRYILLNRDLTTCGFKAKIGYNRAKYFDVWNDGGFKITNTLEELYTDFSVDKVLGYVTKVHIYKNICVGFELEKTILIKHLPQWEDADFCRKILEINFNAFRCIPSYMLDIHMCLSAVNAYGLLLEFVPEEFRTLEVCLIACKHPGLLEFVPDTLKTTEFYYKVIEADPYNITSIRNDIITDEMWHFAFNLNVRIIGYMPIRLITDDMCLKAVTTNACSIDCIPEDFLTEDLCLTVVRDTMYILSFIPVRFRTYKVCEEALNIDHSAFSNVPPDIIDENLCKLAVKKNGCNIQYVPVQFITEQLCLDSVRNNPYSIRYLSPSMKTNKVCYEAIKQKAELWANVPTKKRTCTLTVVYWLKRVKII